MGALETPFRYEDCPWDFDRDGDIDFQDLAYFLSQYSIVACPCVQADFDCSGNVGFEDLAEFLSHYSTSCEGAGGGNMMSGFDPLTEWLLSATPEEVLAWWYAGMPPVGGGER